MQLRVLQIYDIMCVKFTEFQKFNRCFPKEKNVAKNEGAAAECSQTQRTAKPTSQTRMTQRSATPREIFCSALQGPRTTA